MGGEHDGGAVLLEPGQRAEHLLDAGRVQARRGLVEQQHRRAHGDGPRRGGPLALAVGQLVRRPVRQVLDAEQGERLGHPLAHLTHGQPEVHRPEGHVLGDVGAEQLVVRVLQHELHALPMGPKPLAGVVDPCPVDRHLTARRLVATGQAAQQRRLAGAVGAEQRRATPRPDQQVRPDEHGRSAGIGGVQPTCHEPLGRPGERRVPAVVAVAHDPPPSVETAIEDATRSASTTRLTATKPPDRCCSRGRVTSADS